MLSVITFSSTGAAAAVPGSVEATTRARTNGIARRARRTGPPRGGFRSLARAGVDAQPPWRPPTYRSEDGWNRHAPDRRPAARGRRGAALRGRGDRRRRARGGGDRPGGVPRRGRRGLGGRPLPRVAEGL